MKTTVRLGILQILVEADDEQELVRKAWDIYRLNEAATQEGYSLDDVMPFAETGSDDNEYAGFIILSDPGKRINFGHTKAGKRWYPRTKGSEHYKGVTQFGQMDTSRQLAEKSERPQIGGQATQRPASQGDGASAEPEPPYHEWFAMLEKKLNAKANGDLADWMSAKAEARSKTETWPDVWQKKVSDLISNLDSVADDLPF